MIHYALKCAQGHSFESWFQNAKAYDGLIRAGMVLCPVCGGKDVEKAIMAPQVRAARDSQDAPQPPQTAPEPATPLSQPANPAEQTIADVKARIEAESEYVGMSFASEARAMHEGEAPSRSIYGEAKPEDARKMVEDGVPVIPLPFIPGRKTN